MLDDNVLLHAKGIMFACFTCYQICLGSDLFASSVRPGWNWHVGLLAFGDMLGCVREKASRSRSCECTGGGLLETCWAACDGDGDDDDLCCCSKMSMEAWYSYPLQFDSPSESHDDEAWMKQACVNR